MTSHIALSTFPYLIPAGEVLIALIVRLLVAYGICALAYYHIGRGRSPLTHDIRTYARSYSNTLVILGALIEFVLAILIFIGLYTQIAALLSMILFLKILFLSKYFPHFGNDSRRYYWTLCILSFALVLTGSGGYFSFDYPL
jgi:uncharacterized membrane protein YphA (DoxX/SURF4 family)